MSVRHDRASRTLWYLCLELPIEGHASHTHVTGIIKGLSARGWRTTLWHPPSRAGVRGPARRLLDSLTTQARLLLRRDGPDVMYIRGHFASLPTVVWARLRGVPVAFEVNGPYTDVLSSWPRARWVLPLIRASAYLQLRLSTLVIAVTPELCRSSSAAGARQCHVVSNGADVELFTPSASTASTAQILPTKFVSFAGTLATWQGIDTLLAAMDRPTWPPDVSLVIIGDGVLTDVVRAKAEVDPRVTYLGRLPPRDVSGIVARSLGAIAPKSAQLHARTGVVPLKLFEAMASGVPVVVTDLPGQADIVSAHACGIVIRPGDPSAIAGAVATLAGDPELARQMGERGRTAAVAEYSWDASAGRTHEILVGLARD
ncbi:MAG: glycosyltransferase family 4 protein [Chloroflexota bacterium]